MVTPEDNLGYSGVEFYDVKLSSTSLRTSYFHSASFNPDQ